MSFRTLRRIGALHLAGLLLGALPAFAQVVVQCPEDTDGDGVPDVDLPNVVCTHVTAGDGYAIMGDGRAQFIFGFHDVTTVPQAQVPAAGLLAANFPAPTIALDEGQQFYLNVTNVGMVIRPDLFDPHSIHFHGFPQQAPVFDGLPESAFAINQEATLTYYYNLIEPGTYMYHCHVEATEHMQMGMLGNLFVRPAQNGTPKTYKGKTYTQFAYNDGDGSTGYDHEVAIQIGSFDPAFHDASESIQPLPFAPMKDRYPMLNGRGYPDTIDPDPLPPPSVNGGNVSQPVSSAIGTASDPIPAGSRILLRISNLNVTRMYTLATLGLPMEVVGLNARLLRGPDPDESGPLTGKDLYYTTSSVTLGGGESVDVMLDTSGVAAGTYFLYTTNLNYLSNNDQDYGGMMTEIEIGN